MRSLLWVLLVAIGTASAAAARPAADLGWTAYKNPRFGLQMRYPAGLFTLHRTSQARDGDLFTTADGSAKLLIGAFENTERHSPASYQRFIAREFIPGLADGLRAGGCRLVSAFGHARRNDDLRESDLQLFREGDQQLRFGLSHR